MDQESLTSIHIANAASAERAQSNRDGSRPAVAQGLLAWRLKDAMVNAAARYPFFIFLSIASFYCLLTYIPFTYYAIIQNPFLSWLKWYAQLYKYIFLATLIPLTLALLKDSAGLATQRIARAFAFAHLPVAAALLLAPPLTSLPHDYRCLFLSLVIPFPFCWAGLIEHSVFAERGGWKHVPVAGTLDGSAFMRATVLLSTIFALTSSVRYLATTHGSLRPLMTAVPISVLTQVIFGALIFATLALLRALLARTRASAVSEFIASSVFLFLAIAIVLRKLVLASLSLNNAAGNAFSIIVALQVVTFLTGLSVRLYSSAPAASVNAFSLPFYFLAPLFTRRRYVGTFLLLLAATLAYWIPLYLQQSDWDALFQRLTAVFIWCAALTWALSRTRNAVSTKRQTLALVLTLVTSLIALHSATGARLPERLFPCTGDHCVADDVEQYSGFDPSLRAVRDIVSPALEDGEHADFYTFLQRNSNIATSVKPTDINLVANLGFTPAHKPNIFIFVVDSLRQDYLSPYNSRVDFTPNIARFARESVVMQNAFTRYGGTALSEPAIWAGAMQVHKQYVQPYYPMNTLQKLIEAERYQAFVTLDPIMRQILAPSNAINELDRDTRFQNYDLCGTLKEIEARIDRRRDSVPIFAYTQSMNLHLFGLHLARNVRQPRRAYPGFDATHASELERLDAGFGEFVSFLKARGLYEDSIIVLTSDHGDSIGEYGRFGHDGAPFPELLRIPLIIHIPVAMREKLSVDTRQAAFNIDITPTLYYLLGHTDIHTSEVIGRPLFVATKDEAARWTRATHLIASSYLPVYGLLEDNGSKLFIADAQAGTSYFYDLTKDPEGSHNRVTNEIRARSEQLIRQHIGELNRFYHLNIQ